jgi:hypothetical protein
VENGQDSRLLDSRTLLAWSDGVYETEDAWTEIITTCEQTWLPATVWWNPWTWGRGEYVDWPWCVEKRLIGPLPGHEAYRRVE